MWVSSASAQHYIGVKGSYGGATGRFYPRHETKMVWNKYNAGLMWKYYSDQQVVGGVSAEIEYMTRGYRYYEGTVSETESYDVKTRVVNSIMVPLIWQPHIYLARRHLRVFVNAGFTVSYNLGIGDTFTTTKYNKPDPGEKQTFTTVTVPYIMDTARDNRWNYGICFGGGTGVLFGRWEIFAEARYYFGMSDILRTKTKYIFNEQQTIRSELDNLFITVGLFFRLGKGGITEPPLRKRRVPPPSESDFRNIKLRF